MADYKPMLAVLGDSSVIKSKDFIFEPKLDGYRALLYKKDKEIKLISRNNINLTSRFPELCVQEHIRAKSAVLDGEIVVYNRKGIPSFQLVQGRSENPSTIESPATYVAFDILEKDGKSLISLPLTKRKKILKSTVSENTRIQSNLYTEDGKKLWDEVKKRGLEGVMAKKKASIYQQIRSKDWIKIKLSNTIDAIILGFVKGKRSISSLILGVYDKDNKKNNKNEILNIGKVGTGFSEELLKELEKKFLPLITKQEKDITYIKPKLVAEIKYHELTNDKQLRAPVFLRLRDDKKPEEAVFSS